MEEYQIIENSDLDNKHNINDYYDVEKQLAYKSNDEQTNVEQTNVEQTNVEQTNNEQTEVKEIVIDDKKKNKKRNKARNEKKIEKYLGINIAANEFKNNKEKIKKMLLHKSVTNI